jgi:flavin reductase (DIM6/NTAB) family NADH-FMN oxidoreductase RutF
MMLSFNLGDFEKMQSRYRATLFNSLAGFKTAVLVGSTSEDGHANLAVFNSIIHIGANPPMYAFILRPDTVRRDTLSNILETGFYTFNYLSADNYEKVHQSSAKYEKEVSEFEKIGLEELYIDNFFAPFVKEAPIKIGLKFLERVDISVNGTIMIIGAIEFVQFEEKILSEDGFVALEKNDILACTGLDAYYRSSFIGRLSYAKPDKWPERID